MEDVEAEKYLREIKHCLREGRDNNLSASETFGMMDGIVPTKTIYVKEPPQTSPERLEYMREWRKDRKRLRQLELKIDTKEKARNLKLEKAKRRTGFVCYSKECVRKHIECDPKLNTHTLQNIRGLSRKKIIVMNKCGDCGNDVHAFGGYLDII